MYICNKINVFFLSVFIICSLLTGSPLLAQASTGSSYINKKQVELVFSEAFGVSLNLFKLGVMAPNDVSDVTAVIFSIIPWQKSIVVYTLPFTDWQSPLAATATVKLFGKYTDEWLAVSCLPDNDFDYDEVVVDGVNKWVEMIHPVPARESVQIECKAFSPDASLMKSDVFPLTISAAIYTY